MAMLKKFQTDLGEFDATLRQLHEGHYHRDDWTIGHSVRVVETPEQDAIDILDQLRDTIAQDIEQVDSICDQYNISYVWSVYPSRGPIGTFNVFRAFINLALEREARPTLLQVMDLINQAISRCENEILQATSPKPLAALSRGISSILGWLFPSEKQRLVVGWLIIVTSVGLMLRYVFGFHLDDIGKLVVKWVFNK